MPEREQRARVLLSIAREAIADAQMLQRFEWPEPWLLERGASFVTLRLAGELRGCIGTVDPHRALGDDVAHNAHAAAHRDPRFAPVARQEREQLQIEVSVLSPRVRLEAASEAEAAAKLAPGVDGVYLEYQELRATFLPQVWDHLPDPYDFLRELRLKARLPGSFWHPELRLSRYSVEKYR